MNGLTPLQEIVEVKLRNIVSESPKVAIDRALSEKPLHRIISLSASSSEEFNTAGVILIVIEYLEEEVRA